MLSREEALRKIPSYREVMRQYESDPAALKPSEFIRRGWCRGVYAKDQKGKSCDPISSYAIAWCLYGACDAAFPIDSTMRFELEMAVEALCERNFSCLPPQWNDEYGQSQREVVAFLEYYGL